MSAPSAPTACQCVSMLQKACMPFGSRAPLMRSRALRRARSFYVNKNLIGMYRGVGFPLACVLAELLTDLAADAVGIDAVNQKA